MNNFDVVRAAWWLHRREPGFLESVTLPAEKIATVLGRKSRHPNRNYMAHGNEGRLPNHITCGGEIIWKTGGADVCAWVLANASAEDLDRLDYIEELMWRSHVLNRRAAGHDVPRNFAPTVWRDRRKLEPAEHQTLMDRLDTEQGEHMTDQMAGTLEDWR